MGTGRVCTFIMQGCGSVKIRFGSVQFGSVRFSSEKVDACRKTVNAAASSAAERASAVEASQNSVVQVASLARQCATDWKFAKEKLNASVCATAAARDAILTHAPKTKDAEEACWDRTADLEKFVSYNVSCFEGLRDSQTENITTTWALAECVLSSCKAAGA